MYTIYRRSGGEDGNGGMGDGDISSTVIGIAAVIIAIIGLSQGRKFWQRRGHIAITEPNNNTCISRSSTIINTNICYNYVYPTILPLWAATNPPPDFTNRFGRGGIDIEYGLWGTVPRRDLPWLSGYEPQYS